MADFSDISIFGKFIIKDSKFIANVSFYSAEIKSISFEGKFPFWQYNQKVKDIYDIKNNNINKISIDKIDFGLDLRQALIIRYEGDMNVLKKIIRFQNSDKFTISPYKQLEQFWLNSGNYLDSNNVYIEGKIRSRRLALTGKLKWPFWKLLKEYFLSWTTGNRVQTWRMLIPIIIVVSLGIFIFSRPGALQQKAQTSKSDETSRLEIKINNPSTALKIQESLLYSIDVFWPIDLKYASDYKPTSELYRYAFVSESLLGWLITPIFILCFTHK